MTILRENEAPLLDSRYLRKDSAATNQSVDGTGTITFAHYNLTVAAGALSVTQSGGATVTLTAVNSAAGGGVAASFQRSGTGGTALQVGTNVALTNFIVTAAGAFTASGLATLSGGSSMASTNTVTGTLTSSGGTFSGSWAGTVTFSDTNSGSTAVITLSNATATCIKWSGSATATPNTTGNLSAGDRLVLYDNGSTKMAFGAASDRIAYLQVGVGAGDGFKLYERTGATAFGILTLETGNGLGLGSGASVYISPTGITHGTGFTFTASGTTVRTMASDTASGSNVGFTFTASNGPNTTAIFVSTSTTVVSISSAGAITVGNSGSVISKAATSAALSIRNATNTLADINLNVLGAAPGTLQDGDFWITDITGTRKLNARIGGVTYGVAIT